MLFTFLNKTVVTILNDNNEINSPAGNDVNFIHSFILI